MNQGEFKGQEGSLTKIWALAQLTHSLSSWHWLALVNQHWLARSCAWENQRSHFGLQMQVAPAVAAKPQGEGEPRYLTAAKPQGVGALRYN